MCPQPTSMCGYSWHMPKMSRHLYFGLAEAWTSPPIIFSQTMPDIFTKHVQTHWHPLVTITTLATRHGATYTFTSNTAMEHAASEVIFMTLSITLTLTIALY